MTIRPFRLAVTLACATLVVAACSDQVPAPSTQTPSAAPPVTAPSQTPAGPTFRAGARALPLEIGDPIDLPENLALIVETGCSQCDGPTTGFSRVYRDATGALHTDTLLTLESLGMLPYDGGAESPHISGFAIAADLTELAVSVCVRGTCAVDGLSAWSAESLLVLYRSTDGGISWSKYGELAHGLQVRGIRGPGQYIVSRSETRNVISYAVFPSGEPVLPPAGGSGIVGVVDGQPLWWTQDSRILEANGATFVDFGEGSQVGRVAGNSATTAVVWHWGVHPAPSSDYVSIMSDGGVNHTFQLPGLSLSLFPYAGAALVGNAFLPSYEYLPVIIDPGAGVLLPITQPFVDPDFPRGRNQIAAAQRGPFARVADTGACLNIREAPGVGASVLECVADGVLLSDAGELAETEMGAVWRKVRTPAGAEGWASVQYLHVGG